MKKYIVLLLVLALTFAVFSPASAGGNGPGGGNGNGYAGGNGTGTGTGTGTGNGSGTGQQGTRGTFAVTGTITAIGTNSVTIAVVRGSKLVQPYIGTPVTVVVTPQTRFLYRTDTGTTIITISDLKPGQPVSVNGTVTDNIWTASRITVGARLSCLP